MLRAWTCCRCSATNAEMSSIAISHCCAYRSSASHEHPPSRQASRSRSAWTARHHHGNAYPSFSDPVGWHSKSSARSVARRRQSTRGAASRLPSSRSFRFARSLRCEQVRRADALSVGGYTEGVTGRGSRASTLSDASILPYLALYSAEIPIEGRTLP